MSDPESAARIQTVRNAWTNMLRAEVLRNAAAMPELARVAAVGVWIATYADADGGEAFPSRQTLAQLAGASQEAVTRAVKVLLAAGVLKRRRRPNRTAVYQLLLPVGHPDWAQHMSLYTETRQRRARALRKEREAAERAAAEIRTASGVAVRTATPVNGPDSDPAKPSGPRPGSRSGIPDRDPGRLWTATADVVRTASAVAPTSTYLPSVGTHNPDQDMAGHPPQPQAARANQPPGAPPVLREAPPPPPGARAPRAPRPGASSAQQPPLLLPVPAPTVLEGARAALVGRCEVCDDPLVRSPRHGHPERTVHARCAAGPRAGTA